MRQVLDPIDGQHDVVTLTETQVNDALAGGLIYECPDCSKACFEASDIETTAYHTTLDSDEDNWDAFVARITAATYSLLVSNVGWVRNRVTDYNEVKRLFDEYSKTGEYEQVTMWSSAEHDPIEDQEGEELA
jgi:hypothetical protein